MALQILLQPEGGSVSHLQAKGFFFFKKLLSLHLIMVALSETNHSDGYWGPEMSVTTRIDSWQIHNVSAAGPQRHFPWIVGIFIHRFRVGKGYTMLKWSYAYFFFF